MYKKKPPPFPLDQKVIKAKAQATQEEILEHYYEHTKMNMEDAHGGTKAAEDRPNKHPNGDADGLPIYG